MRGARLAWIWAALLAGLPAAPPGGAAQPATAAQVAALVTASHRITTLPRTVAAELPTASRESQPSCLLQISSVPGRR